MNRHAACGVRRAANKNHPWFYPSGGLRPSNFIPDEIVDSGHFGHPALRPGHHNL